jgi:hypothetical protein
MTYRDLFRVVIRMFALMALVYNLFTAFPQFYSYMNLEPNALMFLGLFVSIALLFGIFFLLIVKADLIIDVLRLDKGFDRNEISLQNITTKSLLQLGVILVGGSTLIDAFPELIVSAFGWFSDKVRDEGGIYSILNPKTDASIGYVFIRVLIGYLLISNFDRVASFLTPKKENAD